MKKLIAFMILSTGLAIGCTSCAHQQLTTRRQQRQQQRQPSIDITVLGDATALGALIETQQR